MRNCGRSLGARARALAMVGLASSFSVGLAQDLPPGFQDSVVWSGLTNPTAVRFAPDGRVFVAEKRGIIYTYDSVDDPTPTVFADLTQNVYDVWDRGLLGLAIAPGWPVDPYIYVFYTYDAPPGQTAPVWDDDCPDPPGFTAEGCVASGRLSRLEAAGDVMTGTEAVLIADWCQQYPSHSVGDIAFGPDGALYATSGDGASFNFVDIGQVNNPCGDPPGEGGALRCQDLETSGDPVSLNGTLIRIDPVTGQALPDNPLFGGADATDDRIIAYGLRNPFRLTIHPLTGELWIADVGWARWEEINRVIDPIDAVIENFGWPCYEGEEQQIAFDIADVPICENLYTTGTAIDPYYTYFHTGGSAITGLAFYMGGDYPASYEGALFVSDYTMGWIKVMFPDGNGLPDTGNMITFDDNVRAVDLQVGPDGDVYYVDIFTDEIRRIEFFSTNQPPTAMISADVTGGASPLTVQFDGTASFDPDAGDMLSFAWDLDGDEVFDDSIDPMPQWTYASSGSVPVRLEVTDLEGAVSVATLLISVDNGPPMPTILSPLPRERWKVGDTISFSGQAVDPDDGALGTKSFEWDIVLLHCSHDDPEDCHEHMITSVNGVEQGSFVAIDHEYPSFLELRLTATDEGLIDWWDPSWEWRQRLTFDNSQQSQGLRNFPVLVRLDPSRIDYARVGPNGEDLRFIASNTTLVLPYEIETWNPGGVSEVWVLAPRIGPNSDADFVWMYYGNGAAPDGQSPAGVWTSNYAGVWHLGASLADSAGFGNDGTNTGSVEVPGIAGNGRFFNGIDDTIDIGDDDMLDLVGDLTLEAWVQVADPDQPGSPRVLSKKVNWDDSSGFNLEYKPLDNNVTSLGSGTDFARADGIDLDTSWHQLVTAISGGQASIFVDGVEMTTDSTLTPVVAGPHRLVFARSGGGTDYFHGAIDEVRLSSIRRSDEWIAAQYLSMTDAFVSFGVPTQNAPLTTTTVLTLEPQVSHLTLRSVPPGLELGVYSEVEESPSHHDVIVNAVTTISAPTPQMKDGTLYEFVAWSDQGAATHEITTSAEDQTLTAIFRATNKRIHTTETPANGGTRQ